MVLRMKPHIDRDLPGSKASLSDRDGKARIEWRFNRNASGEGLLGKALDERRSTAGRPSKGFRG